VRLTTEKFGEALDMELRFRALSTQTMLHRKDDSVREERIRVQRYRRIADDLLADILNGNCPIGSRLPTESEIADRYAVGRHTTRQAVQELVRLGLVTRRRGAGTVVINDKLHSRFVNSITSIEDLLQYAAATRLKSVRVRPALALPQSEGWTPDRRPDEWTQIEGLRYMEGLDLPLCWVDLFLHPEIADIAPLIGADAGTAVYRLIESQHAIVIGSIIQTIDAVVVGGDVSQALNVESGTAALKIARVYKDLSGRVMEIAVNIHPAGRFSYMFKILRQSEENIQP